MVKCTLHLKYIHTHTRTYIPERDERKREKERQKEKDRKRGRERVILAAKALYLLIDFSIDKGVVPFFKPQMKPV